MMSDYLTLLTYNYDKQYTIILLVASVMFPTAIPIFPKMTSPLSAGGMLRPRSNVSDCSAIVSIVTATLIVVVVALAGKVAVIGVEV